MDLRREIEAARAAGDDERLGALEVAIVWQLLETGDFQDALPYADDAVARLAADPSAHTFCCSLLNAGRVHAELGHVEEAIRYYTQALGLEDAHQHGHSAAEILARIAALHRTAGRDDDARTSLRAAVAASRQPASGSDDLVPIINLAVLEYEHEQHEHAADLLMDVLPELVPDATRRDVGWILSQGGMAARRRDEFALAIARYERALTVYGDAERGQRRLFTEAFLATAYNLNGDLDAAEAHFRAALALIDQGVEGPRGHRAAILHDLADICDQRGDLLGARLLLEQTLEIGAQNGDPERLVKAHQGLAGVAERQSDEPRARTHASWAARWRTIAAVEHVFPRIAERAGPGLWSVVLGMASDGRLGIINHAGFTEPQPSSSEINALREKLVQIHADTAVVICSALEAPVSPEEGIRRPTVGDLKAAILVYIVTSDDVAVFWTPLGQIPEVRNWAVLTGPIAWTSRSAYPAVVTATYQALANPKRRAWLPWH